MMDKDITDPSFKYAPSQNPIDPLNSSGSSALPNTMAQQVDFVPSGDDFADTIAKQTRQRIADQTNAMNLAISKAAAGNADEAAAAQRLGYETGVGADIAARNMKALQERVAVDRIGQLDLMRADPVLAKMLSDQNFAAIAHDDVDNLQSTGTMLDSVMGVKNEFLLGRERGYATTALGKTGGKMLQDSWLGKPLLEADRAEARRQVAEMEKMRGSGGFAESFGALEGQMESGLPQQIEMAGVGAVAGGAILGLPSGGLGLVPGMVAGAELGFLSASAVQSFEIESGASFVDLLDQDIPEDTARTAATIVGTINAGLEMIPLKFFTSRAKTLIKSAVQEQVVSSLVQVPGIKNAVGKFVKEWTTGIGVESVTEVVQELTNMWGEEFSKYQTDPDFQAKLTTKEGVKEVATRLGATFEEVAKGMAVMGFIMPGANFALDAKRARKANKARQFFKDIGKDAAASKVRERNPNSYQAWFAARAKGTGAETIYVDVDKVRGAMVKNGINQEQLQFLLPDLYKQLQAIGANSGVDVTIPTSVYAARLVDTAFGQDLQSDMRLNPDDMSINDNNEYVKTRDRRVAELVKLSDEMTASDEILAESAKVVENRVVAEIMAVGKYTELEAKAMAAAHVAFAVVNAPEFGMTPEQFDTQYGMATRGEGQAIPAAPLEQANQFDQAGKRKTTTPEWKKWFGKSKVVDKAGEPIVLYRGEDEKYPSPKIMFSGGIFLTTDKSLAKNYGPYVMEVFASIEKPLDVSEAKTITLAQWKNYLKKQGVDVSKLKFDSSLGKRYGDYGVDTLAGGADQEGGVIRYNFYELLGENDSWFGDGNLQQELQRQGFDGVKSQPESDLKEGENRSDVWIVWEGNQLKDVNNLRPSRGRESIYEQASRIDANYMTAVESGDMETAQRMVDEAAKLSMPNSKLVQSEMAGLSTEPVNPSAPLKVVFHGGRPGTTTFDQQVREESAYAGKLGSKNLHSQGIWLAPVKGDGSMADFDADTYASNYQGGVVYSLYANITKPARVFDSQIASDNITVESLKAQGYDGAFLQESGVFVAFDANQVKSADPITRDAIGNVIPLSRRFNIASPSILEQAAMPAQPLYPVLAETWKNYFDGEDYGNTSDLADTIEGLVDSNDAPSSLAYVVDQFREEMAYDRQLKGRGDMDTTNKEFESAVQAAAEQMTTPPQVLEQAAMAEPAAESVEAVQETAKVINEIDQQIKDEGNTDVNTKTIDEVVFDDRIPIITLQDLVGKTLFPTIADRTAAGAVFTGVDSSKLEVAMELLGGPFFPLRQSNLERGVVWANRGKGVITKKEQLVKGGAKYMVVVLGDVNMHQSNTTVTNAFLALTSAYIRDGRINKENADKLSGLVKNAGVDKESKTRKDLQQFPGFDDLKVLNTYIQKMSFESRKVMLDVLGGAAAFNLGAPSMQKILDATIEPSLAGNRWGDATLVLEIDESQSFIKLGTEGTREHPDYPLGIRGRVVGRFATPINYEHIWKEWFAKTAAQPVKTTKQPSEGVAEPKEKTRQNINRGFDLAKPTVTVTQELADSVGSMTGGNIDGPRQAELATAMVLNKWAVGGVTKVEGGASPQMFVYEVANSEASSVLNEYTKKEVTDGIKKKTFQIYQLNDQKSRIWFATKVGNLGTEYGVQVPELSDSDIALTAVINNEQGARGIAGPAVVLKALEEGVTCLDCFAIKSEKHPIGFLPTLYAEFGFEIVATVPFDSKYYTPTRLKDAENYWAETGWNKERDGYPDVVIMKWRGTEDDRANVTRRYLRDGTTSILAEGIAGVADTNAQVAYNNDQSRLEEQREVADSGTGRGIQGNTRRSLASRALGVAESIAGLTDEQASNYGISLADRDAVKKSIADARVLEQAAPSPGRRGSFDPTRLLTTLNTKADLSTFLHESSHFFFSVYTDIASRPGAPARIAADVQILLDSFGVKDIAAWNAMTFEEQRKYQEQFAYNFEIYLFEGKAPSIEMQGLFERFSKWLRRVYTSISTELNDIYRREFGEDLPILTDEIRGVMGRMLASEAQIKRAEAVNEMKPQFQTQAESGMDDARWAAYQAMIQEAHDQAVTDLTKASLRQMEWLSNARSRLLKNMQSKHDEIRKEMRAEIEAEVMAEPLYMAMSILKTGQGRAKNGELVQFNDKFKLNLEAVKKMLPSEEIAKLGYGKYGMVSEDGIPPDMVAEIVGFVSGDELVLALLTAKPAKEEIAARLDKRMMDEYGKMNTPEAREAAVQAAIHNEARERFVAVEARFIAKATQPVRVMIDAAKAAARQIVGAKKIDDISPGEYAAAEARASRDAAEAYKDRQTPDAASKSTYTRVYNEQIAKGVDEATAVAEATRKAADASTKAQGKADAYKAKYGDRTPEQVIIRAKQAQFLQNQLVKEATSSLEEVDTAVKDFRKFFGSDEKIAKSRNMDLVDAARAILSYYGFGKVDKNPADYIKKLEAYNPELYAEIAPLISQASTGVRDYTQMTMDDFRMLRDVVDALWAQSRRDKQITVAGKKIALDGVLSELDARLNEIGVPTTVPGEKSALTTKEKFAAHLYSAKALLRRVENWADATDGAGGVGAFTKYIYRPVKDAVNAYRVDRNNYVKRFVDLVSTLDLPVGKITSPELDYTFGVGNGGIGKAELLGAMLHTGNESNYKKLLIGRKWGEFNDDESVNTSRWDAFVGRMITEGVLTKEDFDFLQSVWDLNEEIKPIAQRAHRDLYGYYFKEVEATSFTNRFGTYRGGYVPAKTDAAIVRDAQRQAKAEELEADFRSSMPSTGMGFTKGRVEYNKPLSLDVRLMAKHIDDVLRFAHIQPAIKDALRIVNNRAFADKLSSIDPTAVEFMLLPWLNRTARQSTNEPGRNKVIDNFWRTLRSRTGMAIMFANLRNALQQVTGLFPSALKVSKGALKDSLFAYLASPRKTAEAIAGLSPFMNERMHSQIFEIQDQMNDLLLNPSKFDKIQKWSQHHGYFLQSAFQNFVDIVTWNGKYNQVLSEIGTTLSDSEAQAEAIQQADAAVRSTQGSMSAEDVAAFEVGSPFYKTFVQFTGYFNMLANLNTDEYVKVLRDLGWRGNKGKLVSIYMLGFLAPTLVADAIARSLGAGWDDDDDGYLDDVADWFFGSQVRAGAAMVPFGSAAYTAFAAGFTARTYDDRITSSPSIGSLEASTVGVGKAVVNLASDDKELTGRNVRDVLTLITNATGVPVSVLGRPIGYQMEVNRGKVEPTDPIDYMRGLITGVPSAESKKK